MIPSPVQLLTGAIILHILLLARSRIAASSHNVDDSLRYNCAQHSEKHRCPSDLGDPCAWEEGRCVPVTAWTPPPDPPAEDAQADPAPPTDQPTGQPTLPTWLHLKQHRELRSKFHKKKFKGTNLVAVETERLKSLRKGHVYGDDFKLLQYLNLISRMEKGKALLGDIFRRGPPAPPRIPMGRRSGWEDERTIVAFSAPTSLDTTKGKNAMYFKNFHYFLDNGIDCSRHSTRIVTTKVVCDAYRFRIMKMNHEQCRNSPFTIELIEREDKCYDMESMREFLRVTDTSEWDYFVYINCGMVGPKWDREKFLHWTDVFIPRLSDKIKLVGITINMSFHPHSQSFVLATDRVGINIIKYSDALYDCGVYNDQSMNEEQRWKIIDSYEIGMSRQVINAGYAINSLSGALGDSFTVCKDDFETIVERSHDNSAEEPLRDSSDKNIWDSNTENFLLPYGGDIWDHDGLRSVAHGGIPSWSDFVFFKASREIILPEIEDEVRYDNPKLEILDTYENASLPKYHQEGLPGDICEEAKTNFTEASKLFVIVTGYEHSGTNMLAQLIKSDPGLFGGFECGLLLDKKYLLNDTQIPFYDWLTWDIHNDLWGLTSESRDLVVNDARCDAEMFARLHQYSPLFHYSPNKDSMIVDKTPAYLSRGFVEIMDRTPGVPVVITYRTDAKMTSTMKKRGYSDEEIETELKRNRENLAAATSKYPDRIHLADTTLWSEEPNMVMEGVFQFLGLTWRPEYLNMDAVNVKRVPGSIVSFPHNTSKPSDGGRQLQVVSSSSAMMTSPPTPVDEPTSSPIAATIKVTGAPSHSPLTPQPIYSPTASAMSSLRESGPSITLRTTGSVSITESLCSKGGEARANFVEGTEETLQESICGGNGAAGTTTGYECEMNIVSSCGDGGEGLGSRRLSRGPSSRRLISTSSEASFEIVLSVACNTIGCSSQQDVDFVNAVTHQVIETTQTMIDSGAFALILSSQPSIQAVIDSVTLGCLIAWGHVNAFDLPFAASSTSGEKILWYPDFDKNSGTCKNDGMSVGWMSWDQQTWMYDTLKECCHRYFYYAHTRCMKSGGGTGKWFVDHEEGSCKVDCEEDSGPRCGGLAPGSEQLFEDPRTCCENKLAWLNTDHCEANSLSNGCYGGTGQYYAGDSRCVRDCRVSNKDKTCGGLVKEIYVQLYESAKSCCDSQLQWIEGDLCSARSDGIIIESFWPDMTNSKCVKDSIIPTKDLSLPIYDTVEDCCMHSIHWRGLSDCISDSDGVATDKITLALGSQKYYINWDRKQCMKDCEKGSSSGCGSLAQSWDPLYDTEGACCEQIPWVDLPDCVSDSDSVATDIALALGSQKYYIDWDQRQCTKDCEKGSSSGCGGLAQSWDPLYDTTGACCDQIPWVDRNNCIHGP